MTFKYGDQNAANESKKVTSNHRADVEFLSFLVDSRHGQAMYLVGTWLLTLQSWVDLFWLGVWNKTLRHSGQGGSNPTEMRQYETSFET